MNEGIGTEAPQFLSWEYLFRIFVILSLQCLGIFSSKVASFPFLLCRQIHEDWGLTSRLLFTPRLGILRPSGRTGPGIFPVPARLVSPHRPALGPGSHPREWGHASTFASMTHREVKNAPKTVSPITFLYILKGGVTPCPVHIYSIYV